MKDNQDRMLEFFGASPGFPIFGDTGKLSTKGQESVWS